MEELPSVFIYQEWVKGSKKEHEPKLIDTILELESMKKLNTKLLNQLQIAIQERDEAINQLQTLINKFHSPKPNSSITESNTLSYSPPSSVDSFFETASSPVFSNTNMRYFNHHPNQKGNDPGSEYIDSIAKEIVLPQKGKLLRAVIDAGPLLQTILLQGSLPTWRIPPPLRDINDPYLNIDNHLLHGSSKNSRKFSPNSSYSSTLSQANSKKLQRYR